MTTEKWWSKDSQTKPGNTCARPRFLSSEVVPHFGRKRHVMEILIEELRELSSESSDDDFDEDQEFRGLSYKH